MRTAVVGLGTVSFEHLAKLREMPHVEVVGVCDVSGTLAEAVAERFGMGRPYSDFREMLEETGPAAVHITTPPQAHRDLALAALEHGCHVLVEKPIAPSWADYERIRDAATAHDRLLVEDYTARFSDGVLAALDHVRTGSVGDVVHVDVRYAHVAMDSDRDIVHFAHGLPGGALRDFATHPVSVALALLDEQQPFRVAAWSRRRNPDALSDDELRAVIGGERTSAFVSLTADVHPARFTARVEGTLATLEVDIETGRLHLARSGSAGVNSIRRGVDEVASVASLIAAKAAGRRRSFHGLGTLLQGFYAALETGGEPPVSLAEMDAVNGVIDQLFQPGIQR